MLSQSIISQATGGVERLRIYLPTEFEQTASTMPLLVLLHGGSADENQWIDIGVTGAADCLIGSREIAPMVIVTIDGSRVETHTGGQSPPMERFVTGEVLPYLRTRYPSLGGRDVTSIGGISRGGGWALRIAADRPELFAIAGGHSPTTNLTLGQQQSLAVHNIGLWLDVGNQDPLRARVLDLAASIRSIGHEAHVMTWAGRHDRRYWSHHVEDYLRFYDGAR